MRIFFVVLLLLVFLSLLVALVFLVKKLLKHRSDTINIENFSTQTKTQIEQKSFSINDLLLIASKPETTTNELFDASRYFVQNLIIPPKDSSDLSEEAKKYLSFILLVSSHKNTNAKLISFLSTEAKKKNPAYTVEIETYENQGIESRKVRKK
ncbi:hypothetical protein [Campylobacter mucosalis]|uniref:hypothetical protein n=1 Tax=Campylobacter mucosalis TaxID=202 RepID=UPI0004D48A87|nr:hypothetical protein [Campylobacter mucosalis]KEA45490.1 hypothetical protein CR66_07330 [Campylobacter mucosalis]QKF63342.1 hypothetical protein CMCT_1219 [Campylobacter mucosalis]